MLNRRSSTSPSPPATAASTADPPAPSGTGAGPARGTVRVGDQAVRDQGWPGPRLPITPSVTRAGRRPAAGRPDQRDQGSRGHGHAGQGGHHVDKAGPGSRSAAVTPRAANTASPASP